MEYAINIRSLVVYIYISKSQEGNKCFQNIFFHDTAFEKKELFKKNLLIPRQGGEYLVYLAHVNDELDYMSFLLRNRAPTWNTTILPSRNRTKKQNEKNRTKKTLITSYRGV